LPPATVLARNQSGVTGSAWEERIGAAGPRRAPDIQPRTDPPPVFLKKKTTSPNMVLFVNREVEDISCFDSELYFFNLNQHSGNVGKIERLIA
jgi:hypothetical protein